MADVDDIPTLTLYRYCDNVQDADAWQQRIQSVAGFRVERDEDFIYVMVPTYLLEEAQRELGEDDITFAGDGRIYPVATEEDYSPRD